MTHEIQVQDWKPFEKNTLRGFFTVILPSGLVIHSVMLHVKGDSRWISFPAREYTNQQGEKEYARLLEFTDSKIGNRFRDQVIAALDRHLTAEVIDEGRHD